MVYYKHICFHVILNNTISFILFCLSQKKQPRKTMALLSFARPCLHAMPPECTATYGISVFQFTLAEEIKRQTSYPLLYHVFSLHVLQNGITSGRDRYDANISSPVPRVYPSRGQGTLPAVQKCCLLNIYCTTCFQLR